MNRWQGKVAVVTGASSGIGLATAKALVGHGLTVVGLARRKEKMESEMKDAKGPGKFHARLCDITKEQDIIDNLKWVKDTFGEINVLVNNAGLIKYKSFEEATIAELDQTINVNLLGLVHVTKHCIPIMKSNDKEAHIINVNSLAGHQIPSVPILNVYPASKFGVTAFTETLGYELSKTKIRISSISPGLVKTEMSLALTALIPAAANAPALEADDVASAIVFALGAPAHVSVKDIILDAKQGL